MVGIQFSKHQIPVSYAEVLAEISLEMLHCHDIQGIILDLDNTVVSEDDRFLSPKAEEWIQQAQLFSFQLVILTNGKRKQRVHFWSDRLKIPAIHPAGKPFPKAFYQALRKMQLKPHQVVVIGDSFHTDKVGAWIVGCPMIQVASLPHPKRSWERVIGRFVHRAYPRDRELWTMTDLDLTRLG